jgi:TonB family protein
MLIAKPLFLAAAGLTLLQTGDLSLRVTRSVPAIHPRNTLAAGLSVIEVELDQATLRTRVLYGKSPFSTSALNAITQWRFAAPPTATLSRTSVTFLFRPPTIYSVRVLDAPVKPWMPGEDSSALPQQVIDPGYPPNSVAQGSVILAAHVSSEGLVTSVETMSGDRSLSSQAERAVKAWRFSPAQISGKAVEATAFVVISFVEPT